jgi:hypothetical protein
VTARAPAAVLGLGLALGGCAGPAVPSGSPSGAGEAGAPLAPGQYRIDPGASRAVALVHPAGPLAAAGHAHTVASPDLEGCVRPAGADAVQVAVAIPVGGLVVDAAADRAEAGEGFGKPVPPEDAQATRDNLLGPEVLHGDAHPWAFLTGTLAGPRAGSGRLDGTLTLRGRGVALEVPVTLEPQDGGVRARGQLQVAQTRFGIEPFSAFLGALRVRDRVEIRFDLLARPLEPGAECSLPATPPA